MAHSLLNLSVASCHLRYAKRSFHAWLLLSYGIMLFVIIIWYHGYHYNDIMCIVIVIIIWYYAYCYNHMILCLLL